MLNTKKKRNEEKAKGIYLLTVLTGYHKKHDQQIEFMQALAILPPPAVSESAESVESSQEGVEDLDLAVSQDIVIEESHIALAMAESSSGRGRGNQPKGVARLPFLPVNERPLPPRIPRWWTHCHFQSRPNNAAINRPRARNKRLEKDPRMSRLFVLKTRSTRHRLSGD